MQDKPAVRFPTLVDQLVEHVYDRILRGQLRAGQKITEDQLAKEFGVSRTPIREATRRLGAMGVVQIYPHSSMEVASASPEDICQINQFREDMECLALTYAIPRMSEEDIDRLDTLASRCQRFAQSGNLLETFGADSEFHLAIAAISGNKYLAAALDRLNIKVQLCRVLMCLSKDKIRASVSFHQKIMAAIRQRNVDEAASLMRQHIRGTLNSPKRKLQ
jgi:DNA-binding GntR family transcriptional regulator